jgi:hypothetical protein
MYQSLIRNNFNPHLQSFFNNNYGSFKRSGESDLPGEAVYP